MKIYGKTFLYFGSSLKTVWLTRDARRGQGGAYQGGIVLGDGFELLPHLLAAVSQFIEKSISKH